MAAGWAWDKFPRACAVVIHIRYTNLLKVRCAVERQILSRRNFRRPESVGLRRPGLLASTGAGRGHPVHRGSRSPRRPNRPTSTAAPRSAFSPAQDIPGQWWTLFKSEPINRMIERALKANASLGAVRRRRCVRRTTCGSRRSALSCPTVDAQGTVQRARKATASSVARRPAHLRRRRRVRRTRSTSSAATGASSKRSARRKTTIASRWKGTYLNLVANVMLAAVDEASLRAQIAVTEDIIKSQTQELDLLNQQFQLGAVAKGDVLAQQTQLAQTQASLAAAAKAAGAGAQRACAFFWARRPTEADIEEITFDTLALPQDVPLSVPAKLVDQRPDVRASEAALHQASAQMGVATAAMSPQFPAQRQLFEQRRQHRRSVHGLAVQHHVEPVRLDHPADLPRRRTVVPPPRCPGRL